ncbi:FAD-binding protein [bacterium]
MGIKVINDKCVGCQLCIKACPFGIITMVDKKAVIGDGCTLCGACADICKFEAIEIKREEKKNESLGEYKNVWVFAEQRHGKISPVAFELLNEGRKLADTLNQKLCAVLMGHDMFKEASVLIKHGADVVYYLDSYGLREFQNEPYTNVLTKLIHEEKPNIVLMGATAIGRSFASRVAARINTGLTADCTGLDIDPENGNLKQTRPAFGGNIMATILTPNHRPQMATVRHKVFKKSPYQAAREGEIIKKEVPENLILSRTKLVDFVAEVTSTVNLSEADIIVSGGRGLGEPKGFKLVEELAETIGGAVGASRAAVDSGWIPYSHQVGQTGRTVCPKVYIACGISGAIQHLVGMQSSDIIIAINRDAAAPIFKAATYGIEGDLYEIIPHLITEIKKLRE